MTTLEKARVNSKISKKELISLVYGSEDNYREVQALIHQFEKYNSRKAVISFHEKSVVEKVKQAYRLLSLMIKMKCYGKLPEWAPKVSPYFVHFDLPTTVHHTMVRPIIDILGSEQQRLKWLPLIDSARVIGTYAQTELGHGSDVQSIETHATFNETTRTFILNSPTTSSIKWWPGGLGFLSNIAIVVAKIILKNRSAGVFPLIVQIRDFETHQPLLNIEIGNIGPKLGVSTVENGFLRFTNVSLPYEALLSRYVQITEDGRLAYTGNPKITYSSMMLARSDILNAGVFNLGKALAIALRYSFLSKKFQDGEPIPMIAVQVQQGKLFPLIAKVYAMKCAYLHVLEIINKCKDEISQGNFSRLQDSHIILSGLKSFYTSWCLAGLIACMQSCEEHGCFHYSGMPAMVESFSASTIIEGENSMLALHVSNHLLKCYQSIIEGQPDKVKGHCEYLKNLKELTAIKVTSFEQLKDPELVERIFQKCVVVSLNNIAKVIEENATAMTLRSIINHKIAISLWQMAKIHIVQFTLNSFSKYISLIEHEETRKSLRNLAALFTTHSLIDCCSTLISFDVISNDQLAAAKQYFEELLNDIHKDCLVLSEIFVPDDYILFSAIGDSNEKPYDNLYTLAKQMDALEKFDSTELVTKIINPTKRWAELNPKL